MPSSTIFALAENGWRHGTIQSGIRLDDSWLGGSTSEFLDFVVGPGLYRSSRRTNGGYSFVSNTSGNHFHGFFTTHSPIRRKYGSSSFA